MRKDLGNDEFRIQEVREAVNHLNVKLEMGTKIDPRDPADRAAFASAVCFRVDLPSALERKLAIGVIARLWER